MFFFFVVVDAALILEIMRLKGSWIYPSYLVEIYLTNQLITSRNKFVLMGS